MPHLVSSSPQDWLADELESLREQGLERHRRRLQSAQGGRVRLGDREYLNFASNDYLNLASDPRLARAAARAARRYGCGAGASALVSGHLPPLRALERDLSRWQEVEAVLVTSSGYTANLAAITALAGREDAIFSDAWNHASIIDGCRLSRASVYIYRHGDVAHLEELLTKNGSQARRRLIVTDSVFGMDGDWAPLAEINDLAQQHDALLMIDEAHACGVLGENGRGLVATLTPQPSGTDRLVKVGTLSKALGAQGGFIAGSHRLIEWLIQRARPYIFSTALAPTCAAAARRAVAIVREDPDSRRALLARSERLRHQIDSLGFPAAQFASQCQIVPILIGDARCAVDWSTRLEEQGILAPAIRPPSVPAGTSRLRISLTAAHTDEDVDRLVAALKVVRQ